MESKWLKEREEEATSFRKQLAKKRKIMMIVATSCFVGALIAILVGLQGAAIRGGLICIIPMYTIAMLWIVIGLGKQIQEESLQVVEDLEPYLTSEEAVMNFEEEMYGEVKVQLEVGGGINGCKLTVTEHWLVTELQQLGKPYRVFSLDEIAYIHGTRIDPSQFVITIGTGDEKELFSFYPTGKKAYFKLLQLLLEVLPEVNWQAYTKGMPQKAS